MVMGIVEWYGDVKVDSGTGLTVTTMGVSFGWMRLASESVFSLLQVDLVANIPLQAHGLSAFLPFSAVV